MYSVASLNIYRLKRELNGDPGILVLVIENDEGVFVVCVEILRILSIELRRRKKYDLKLRLKCVALTLEYMIERVYGVFLVCVGILRVLSLALRHRKNKNTA